MSTRMRRPGASAGHLEQASDGELFQAMANGDLGPLGELFDRYHASVHAFAERLLVDPADAADLVQETFLTAARAAASFEHDASAKPFLFGVAAQLARRRRRSFARLRRLLDAWKHAPVEPLTTPEEDVAVDEQKLLIERAVGRLSQPHREVVLMVELGGLSGVEAAKALGIPAGTVWRRLHEARAQLRQSLKRRST